MRLLGIFLICWGLLMGALWTNQHRAHTPVDNSGNECRVNIRGLWVPCDRADPRRFLQEV